MLLTQLRQEEHAAGQLAEIPELSKREVFLLKSSIDSVSYEWRQINEVWEAILRQLMWMAPALFLPVWGVIYLAVRESAFITGPGGVVGGQGYGKVVK